MQPLKQSFRFHAEVLVIPDNNMVQDIDADDLTGFYQPFRQADVLFGGGNITGRVVVDKDAEDSIIQVHFRSLYQLFH